MVTRFGITEFKYDKKTSHRDFSIYNEKLMSYLFTSEITDLPNTEQNALAAHTLIQVGGQNIIETLMGSFEDWRNKRFEQMIEILDAKCLIKNQQLLYL